MEFAYTLGSPSPNVRKFRIAAGLTVTAGQPVISNGENNNADGVRAPSDGLNTIVGVLGVAMDTGNSTAAQIAGEDNAQNVSCIINPDAVHRIKLSNSATADTALVVITEAGAANAAGTTITDLVDEFTVWGYTGDNAGHIRRATDTSTVVHAMPFAIAAGDLFMETVTSVGNSDQFTGMTTDLQQLNAKLAKATGAAYDNWVVVDEELRPASEDGNINSFVHVLAAQHAFGLSGTIAT